MVILGEAKLMLVELVYIESAIGACFAISPLAPPCLYSVQPSQTILSVYIC